MRNKKGCHLCIIGLYVSILIFFIFGLNLAVKAHEVNLRLKSSDRIKIQDSYMNGYMDGVENQRQEEKGKHENQSK